MFHLKRDGRDIRDGYGPSLDPRKGLKCRSNIYYF